MNSTSWLNQSIKAFDSEMQITNVDNWNVIDQAATDAIEPDRNEDAKHKFFR